MGTVKINFYRNHKELYIFSRGDLPHHNVIEVHVPPNSLVLSVRSPRPSAMGRNDESQISLQWPTLRLRSMTRGFPPRVQLEEIVQSLQLYFCWYSRLNIPR